MARRRSRIARWFPLILALVAAGGLYLFYLDFKIRTKFESHRWNLPSRVYSDAFYLFPGQKISARTVEGKLKRLGYKRVTGRADRVGEFARSGSELAVFLHSFSYPSEEFTGFRAQLSFDKEALRSIENLETGESLKTLKLESELIASIFDQQMENRTVVSLEEIPEELVQAVIAIEDERFYSHHGVDPLSTLRALLTDLLHMKFMQGGSTLTQQLVKNYFLTAEKTFIRKINEMLMALLLERRYSKDEILEAYLNEIYFGQQGPVSVAGVEEASHLYFSKSVSQLTLGEAALLAGMIRSPGEYSPLKNLSIAYDRRNFVLKTMRDKGSINEEEYRRARREKIVTAPPARQPVGAPFFVDFLKSQLKENYGDILSSEGLRIFTTLDAEAQEVAEAVLGKRLEALERERLKKLVEEGKSLEGCLIALQPQTGYIRAYAGGRDYRASQFDHISLARRQPGSAFKPFVYLTALAEEGNWTLASQIEDRTFTVKSGGEDWTPKNYDEEEHGTVTLREALEKSYNIATARLALDVGLDRVVATAREAGIGAALEPYPSVALGAFEVTPLELIRAYTIFPNNGLRSEPIAVTNVVTRDGVVLEKKSFKMNRAIAPELAYLMNSALRGVIERGTAAAARAMGFSGLAAGKTGTTSDYRDSWFVGYTSNLLTLTWVGYDDGTPTGLSGAAGGLSVWADFMKRVAPPSSEDDFLATDRIILVKVDKASGKLAGRGCRGDVYEEAFVLGTEPKEKCE